ncbi:MAG: ribbon-helix-helix protein, CopG family [Thermoplasmata archaeon]
MALEKRKPTISLRLPTELLHQVDELVRRTGMRSRTEFVERALVEYVEELKEATVLRARRYTWEEARVAILGYLEDHPGTHVSDLAEALAMEIELAFRVVNALTEEGEVVA